MDGSNTKCHYAYVIRSELEMHMLPGRCIMRLQMTVRENCVQPYDIQQPYLGTCLGAHQ